MTLRRLDLAAEIYHSREPQKGSAGDEPRRARDLLAEPSSVTQRENGESSKPDQPRALPKPYPCCGGRMIIIETFERGCQPTHRPPPDVAAIRIDTS
ncbi:MAG: hypothetical protein WAM17_13865 [Rhodoplanes sp.]